MRVWVDMTAAAHPLVLRPIVERLAERGHQVEVTARDYGQTLGILERLGIGYEAFGSHGGASVVRKAGALAGRSSLLTRWARPRRFDLALAHGSVDLALVGALLRIPTVQMQDYEWAGLQRRISWRAARRVVVPNAIPVERLESSGASEAKLFRYPGLKEDYYLAGFEPDAGAVEDLGLDRRRLLVVVRPPPETSAYHERNPLYEAVIDRLAAEKEASAVVIPRTIEQGRRLRERAGRTIVVPDRAVDAQSLIAFADLVVSAGGTMNREAVALGTPVYTIFSGRMGAVDERLIAEGRLRVLRDPTSLALRRRTEPAGVRSPRDPALLVEGILGAVA